MFVSLYSSRLVWSDSSIDCTAEIMAAFKSSTNSSGHGCPTSISNLFSPRKANFSLYISGDINHQHAGALKKLGKHKTGVGCLYINKLEDIDLKVLKEMTIASLKGK